MGNQISEVWTEVDISNPVLVLERFDISTDTLYVQQSTDHLTWSQTYAYHFDATSQAWTVSSDAGTKASFIDSIDVKGYGLFPLGNSNTYYSYMLGGGLRLNFTPMKGKDFIAYSELSYSRGPAATDWVDTMQAFNISAGMGYKFALGDKLQLAPELGYGVLFHLLDGDLDHDGKNSLEVYVDQQIRLSLTISYAIANGYELILAPMGVMFFENGSIGAMVGCQGGLRFAF